MTATLASSIRAEISSARCRKRKRRRFTVPIWLYETSDRPPFRTLASDDHEVRHTRCP